MFDRLVLSISGLLLPAMNTRFSALLIAMAAGLALPELATAAADFNEPGETTARPIPYLQCVPYARRVSGIQIYGDAHTWWDQAEGRYARGHEPRVGAVLAFRPSGNMRLGHVAAVSRIIDSRTILLRHANWSLIDGRRGQIEDDVRAIDVSPDNDWSAVRVWYAPIQSLGTTHWPAAGFIYNRPASQGVPRDSLGGPSKLVRAEVPGAARAVPARFADDPIGAIIAQKSRRLASR